ncbi:MAG: glycosyl hydrolase family 57 [Phycisphaerae bacterium]|nr:glycosyl hydrolase family 57 [Phycisphaerae bacterium]
MTADEISGCGGDVPAVCGAEEVVVEAMGRGGAVWLGESDVDFGGIRSAFAIALHMHQPLIPAGGEDLRTARVIGNLEYMLNHPDSGDNHNATVFRRCYQRMGEFIPQLVREGRRPRVMLEYSGCLLHGLLQMGAEDVIESLRGITCDREYRRCVEWLGGAWGHAVAPSTPVQDYRLHVRAWQHHFAAIFGAEALGRVRGFSPAEMALPNHPDVCYEFVRTLRECGYRWVLVQEHAVEGMDGGPVGDAHVPHRLIARNSSGQELGIIAIIKTQGSDTKLVGQMQPYYEALGLSRREVGGVSVPPVAVQISDGENGGVMMNEFPSKYLAVMAEASGSGTPPVNVTEYLEYLESVGVGEESLPTIRPIHQKRIWDRLGDGVGVEALAATVAALEREGHGFHVEGGSWTNNVSWVRGYEGVLGPMESVSAMFAEKVLERGVSPCDPRYRNALYHLLMTQTSCYRYWGEGRWTDYGRELCRRTMEILRHDF